MQRRRYLASLHLLRLVSRYIVGFSNRVEERKEEEGGKEAEMLNAGKLMVGHGPKLVGNHWAIRFSELSGQGLSIIGYRCAARLTRTGPSTSLVTISPGYLLCPWT
ncbi:hypothetical protein TNCV_84941 [Trichonephila clavipes]|nr:hypothetical protein TNCV_84941 [Trichonephila clavipes]